ncbi:PAS domain-containing sensor histidine kinase [Bacteroides sp. 519]|uniref:sensor histidine kinase n=1 Tax=Bacteroides sp. 519 TaxID=2302937 RepID=UPI0013D0C356|nr:ATP-binding protein [Bacteroides sp. 519]NDV58860.1 ATP-binding protein [Bacteroides sp. 519]
MNSHIKTFLEYPFIRILAVILITTCLLLFVYLENWLWAGINFAVLCWGIFWLLTLYNAQTRKVIFLLEALENNDSGLRFTEDKGSWTNKTINQLINKVAKVLYDAKYETIQQEKYYELILSCISTGIVVLNDFGYVYQKNDEALKILGLNIFTHVRQLSKIDASLMEKISSVSAGDKLQVLFNNERGTVNLSVRTSDITIKGEHLRILALNDINNELDEKEIDSWIRLIRVLTHEIMNAVTPITSLSDTLLNVTENTNTEIKKGLQTISSTGKGLLAFVESYRKFTRVPTPDPSLFYIKNFVERMVELAKYQNTCNNIVFKTNITPPDLILYADENLISQVMINLLKNAKQAIGNQPEGLIEISAYCNEQDEIFIEVSNNGPQIPQEVAEQIFIPFFTTKEGGSGIGLSLSRQIMRISGGNLILMPAQAGFTTFKLKFK